MNRLSEIAENLHNAHIYDRYVTGLCPFHSDNRPSFFVYADRYYCKSCGASGTTQKLYKLLVKEISFETTKIYVKDDTKRFINPFSIWTKHLSLEKVLVSANTVLTNSPSWYMKQRGITKENQIKFGLGIRENWITFPIYDENDKLVGAVARAGEGNPSESKYVVPSGQSPELLYVPDWELIKRASFYFVVYGIIDALTFAVNGLPALSTVSGKRINPNSFRKLRKCAIIIPDFGEEKEGNKLAANLSWRGKVFRPHYPFGCKDVNDVFVKHTQNFQTYFAEAIPQ